MSLATYGELVRHLEARLHGRDLGALLPEIIGRAHDVIVREVLVTADLMVASAAPPLPTDFRALTVLRLADGRSPPLARASEREMAGLGAGRPRLWRMSGATLTVAPAPDTPYAAKLTYQVARTRPAAEADSNAVLKRYPFAYVYGALAEIKRHLEDAEGEAKYEAMFRAEIAQANAEALAEAFDGRLQTQPSVAA